MKAVWLKGLSEEKNTLAAFRYVRKPSDDLTIRIAASNLYRLFVNGMLKRYGPARAAHGYTRVDEYTVDRHMADGSCNGTGNIMANPLPRVVCV